MGELPTIVILDYRKIKCPECVTSRVLWVGQGRKFSTLDKFFSGMPEEIKQNIKAVAMDMWDPYIKAANKHCPQADIVHDKFHLNSESNKKKFV